MVGQLEKVKVNMAACTLKENAVGGSEWSGSRFGRFTPGKVTTARAKLEAV